MYNDERSRKTNVQRRDFIRIMAGAGLATACTPMRIGLKIYPREFDEHTELVDETLRAFVLTIVPGMPEDDADLTRQFHDPLFRLDAHCAYLASDLCSRAERITGDHRFATLAYEDRASVVADGLAAGGLTTRLYSAAAYVTQIACYASIYDDDKGCVITGFDGQFNIQRMAGVRDPHLDLFRDITSAGTGNPV
jgi:hypothetical protein